ncbi:putative HTH-type transcriptional regulator YdgC [Bacillus sp. J14TS2]|uniref:TetR/AcrR family transcriptional regulator n=1 Tax=Bacillus sp. J14TS2 TaxID=2807188 RepID=UPI001B0F1CA5|nr:TetR/AcrR family transcriptional regulator [Bacillus sp. J14TS2]GIN73309.1 putative HTH-type transcriptional regulator YdgC [Bacillus sp. J14TS2]
MPKRKGEVSREKILTAAEYLFAASGYHGTTVSQIVSEAGLTQAAFYLYFKSKKEILDEIFFNFEQQLAQFVETGQQIGQKDSSEVEEHLVQTYIGLFQLFGANKNVTKIVLTEGVQAEELRRGIVTQIKANMSQNQTLGILKPEINTEVFAELLVASIERIVARYGLDEDYSPENLGHSLGNIIFHGVLKKQ